MRVALGGTFADALPAAPNASAGGTTSRRVPPTRIPGTPSFQNSSVKVLLSWSAFGVDPTPRVVITWVPLVNQTVNWTFTFAAAPAALPQPTVISANCSP